jgi:hypothetical protein
MSGNFGLLALLTRNDALFRERIDQIFEGLVLVVGDLVAIDAPDRILKHNASDNAGFHLPALLKVGFRVIKEVIERLRSHLVGQISQQPGVDIWQQASSI